MPNKSYAYLLNVESNNLVFLETHNTELDLLTTLSLTIEPRKKYIKGYRFLSFVGNLSNKYGYHLLDTATKSGTDATKTATKK